MAKRIKENIRFYLPNDPYFAEVDNLPIRDLLDNDVRMQDQIDELAAKLGTTEGRDKFNELRPYVNAVEPGKVFVTPGTFMARQTLPATREGGLSEQLKSEAATFNVNTRQDAKNSLNRAAGIGRMSPVRLKKNSEGADQSISIEQGSLDDFYSDATPPKFRVDLVYAKGNPGMDTDFGNAELGVVKGAFFLNGGGTSDRDGILLPRFAGDGEVTDDEVDLTIARILSQRVEDVQTLRDTGFVRDKIDPETGNVLYTSIPCPDVVNLQNSISEFLVPSGISQTDLSEFADFALRGRNYFALPIAYVFVPFTYVEGTAIPAENILDIRPFFSTPELTLYERQAILGSYRPGLRNRFLTLTDPKITDIDSINTTQDINIDDLIARVTALENPAALFKPMAETVSVYNTAFPVTSPNSPELKAGKYLAYVHFQVDPNKDDTDYTITVNSESNLELGRVRMIQRAGGNGDDDGFGTAVVAFDNPDDGRVNVTISADKNQPNGITFSYFVVHGYAGLD